MKEPVFEPRQSESPRQYLMMVPLKEKAANFHFGMTVETVQSILNILYLAHLKLSAAL